MKWALSAIALLGFGLGIELYPGARAAEGGQATDPSELTEGSIPALPAAKKISWTEVAAWPDFTTGLWVSVGRPGGPGFPGGPGGPSGGPPGAGPGGPAGDSSDANGLTGSAALVFGQTSDAPLRPAYREQIRDLLRKEANGGASCEPTGLPAADVNFFSPRFYFAKDTIIIGAWSDWYNGWRRIHMDRTNHGNPEPTYMGDSVGHWEGKTLVIDTVGIRAEAQLFRGVAVGNSSTHVIEHIRLLDPDTLEWTKTVENPEILTKPWTTKIVKKRKLNEDFSESFCWHDLENGIAQ